MDGILNINKPWGTTSYRVVAMVKRLSGERRVGHAGTLDPAATGVLPVCLGQGTRVIEFLMDATKAYRADIELGVTTDTYDASGQVIQRTDPSGIGREQVESALATFRGDIQQTPPMYSAVKYQGRPLYELARAGITVKRRSRLARIHSLEFAGWQPPIVTLEVVCGKGTYIRSLAHDLGETLGCGATLKDLVRLRCGPFDISRAVSMPQLEDAFRHGCWPQLVYPIDSVLWHWTAVVVSEEAGWNIRHGCPVAIEDVVPMSDYPERNTSSEPVLEGRCRAYAFDGHFLAVLRFDSEKRQWQPEKVFHS